MPNQFVDYLMSEDVGFASYEALGVAENNSKGKNGRKFCYENR